jgi:hypothetical protein
MGIRPEYEDAPDDDFDEVEDVISLDRDDGPDLGPDERDMDLMDGSWEAERYGGRAKSRDWNAIIAGVALVVIVAMLLPMLLVVFD